MLNHLERGALPPHIPSRRVGAERIVGVADQKQEFGLREYPAQVGRVVGTQRTSFSPHRGEPRRRAGAAKSCSKNC